jgi:hypothetical protein
MQEVSRQRGVLHLTSSSQCRRPTRRPRRRAAAPFTLPIVSGSRSAAVSRSIERANASLTPSSTSVVVRMARSEVPRICAARLRANGVVSRSADAEVTLLERVRQRKRETPVVHSQLPTSNYQRPTAKTQAPLATAGHWELGIGSGWELVLGRWELTVASHLVVTANYLLSTTTLPSFSTILVFNIS